MATRERSLEEKLASFAQRWESYQGMEIADTHRFIWELHECYGVWDYEPGTVFEQHPVSAEDRQPAMFEDAPKKGGSARGAQQRMDFYVPRVVIWEMKGPNETNLQKHHDQILLYWAKRHTRYLVLCNFKEFWIYDTDVEGGQHSPKVKFPLAELPRNAESLRFLVGGEAYFAQRSADVTRKAAQYVGGFLRDLVQASKNQELDRPRFTKFTLECVFAMFAEDAGIFKTQPFTAALEAAQKSGDLSPVYNLFDDLGREREDDRTNMVPYVNGPLFDREHPKFPVAKTLLANLYTASKEYDWGAVRPEVFGSIFERALLAHERHSAGAHFTAETDIMKVVGPTIVRPWRERIEACTTHKDVEALIERMKHYHVLDPACGSGNFLYIAYRELKRLEADLRARHTRLYKKVAKRAGEVPPPPPGPYFSIRQLHGIDKLDEAVQLTRVVLWIGEFLANQELSLGESSLPLTPLSDSVLQADALFVDWRELVEKSTSVGATVLSPADKSAGATVLSPASDGGRTAAATGQAGIELAIIGNPPFMGRHKMRLALGDEYVDRLHKAFPNNRNADLVTYWYPKAIETLREGERAGFVSSNSIAQNESREASIDRVLAAGGTLHDCWKSYPWPGEAAVHVSILNWVNSEYEGLVHLDGKPVDTIGANLAGQVDVSLAATIGQNLSLCFKGVEPGSEKFVLDGSQREAILSKDSISAAVLPPFLDGRDLNRSIEQAPTRWIIDFTHCSDEDVRRFSGAFRYAQEHVYPDKQNDERKLAKEKKDWFRFRRPVIQMRKAISGLSHYLAIPHVSPHLLAAFVSADTVASNLIEVIALDSYYHFGVLQSAVHEYWAWARGSTLEERLRYTNTTIFETFPFPLLPDGKYDPRVVPSSKEAQAVAKVAETLYGKRQAACKALNLGLTKLYNLIKGKTPLTGLSTEHQALVIELQQLHEQLNNAVCACYIWPEDTWRNENDVLSRLLELNRELAG